MSAKVVSFPRPSAPSRLVAPQIQGPRDSESATVDATSKRYRRLVGEAAWLELPETVRHRFSKVLAPQQQTIYRGEVVRTELSAAGQLLAQLARVLGGPMPFTPGATGPSVVIVTEEPSMCGQVWTRCYARPGRFPQVIQSAKRFQGATGLEEYLGYGLVMRLTVHVEERQLVFRSAGFSLCLFGRNIPLPGWLAPGRCVVTHRGETDERFSFTLTLDHPWLGRLIRQVAFYEEAGRVVGPEGLEPPTRRL